MFVCDKCGNQRQDAEASMRQVGGSGVICIACVSQQTQGCESSRLMDMFREKDFERRESIALHILAANLANPQMNGQNSALSVPGLIKASFRVADEFILYSTETFKLELKRSCQVESTE